jgi:hypothetical protein
MDLRRGIVVSSILSRWLWTLYQIWRVLHRLWRAFIVSWYPGVNIRLDISWDSRLGGDVVPGDDPGSDDASVTKCISWDILADGGFPQVCNSYNEKGTPLMLNYTGISGIILLVGSSISFIPDSCFTGATRCTTVINERWGGVIILRMIWTCERDHCCTWCSGNCWPGSIK